MPRFLDRGDVFAQMIQDHTPARAPKLASRSHGFGERFTGDESPGKAVVHSAPRDGVGDAPFRRQPEDEVSQERVRDFLPTALAAPASRRLQRLLASYRRREIIPLGSMGFPKAHG